MEEFLVINYVIYFNSRYQVGSSSSKFRKIRDISRRKENEKQNPSICSCWMFGTKKSEPCGCVPWSCTCRCKKAKYETRVPNTLGTKTTIPILSITHTRLHSQSHTKTLTHTHTGSLLHIVSIRRLTKHMCIFNCNANKLWNAYLSHMLMSYFLTKQN